MKIQERAPYLPFGLAMAFLGLPLFAVLFDTFVVLVGWRQGHWVWLDWDGALLGAAAVVFVFNGIIALSLVQVARKKLMRRHWRYALFLAGVGALSAWVFGAVLSSVADLGLHRSGSWVVCYAASVFLLAVLSLPKKLTRAPEQVVQFYPRAKK